MKIYNFLLHLFCSRLTFISCQELKLKSFSSAWWDIEKGPESIFDEYRSRSDIIKLRKVDIDDNLIHTCYEYAFYKKGRLNRKNTFCYPAVVITGVYDCTCQPLPLCANIYFQTGPKMFHKCIVRSSQWVAWSSATEIKRKLCFYSS